MGRSFLGGTEDQAEILRYGKKAIVTLQFQSLVK